MNSKMNMHVGGDKGIDIVKYLMSILVVLRHAIQNYYDKGSYPYLIVTNGLSTVAVPFFFIATGFLFFNKGKQDVRNVQKQVVRLIKLYVLWSAVYSPLVVLQQIKNNNMTLTGLIAVIQKLFFSAIYYHLWYIPAAAVALVVIWGMKNVTNDKVILSLSLILFIVGLLDDSYSGIIGVNFFDHYNRFFLTTRNGVFFGGLFVEIGSVIAEHSKMIGKHSCFRRAGLIIFGCVFLIFESVWNYTILGEHVNNMMLMSVPVSVELFLLALQIYTNADTKKLRNMSTLIYVIHPLIIVVERYIVKINAAFLNVIIVLLISGFVAFLLEKAANRYKVLKIIM